MICSLLLEIQKRCSYLENNVLYFVLLVLKLCSTLVVISLPFWIKLTLGQLLLLFLYNCCSIFSYVGGVLVTNPFTLLLINGYSENCNTRRTFVIIFLICSDLLFCLRSVRNIVTTTEIS